VAKIDDLLGRVSDPRLRADLRDAALELKRSQNFGIVFEQHIPELSALTGSPPRTGSTVRLRNGDSDRLYSIARIDGDMATLVTAGTGESSTARLTELSTVKRFGEPVFPSLAPLGSVDRDPSRSYHAVINGENFHALQVLVSLYESQVDCIYVDPPYNTGARDSTYNNRYVDTNDVWRHSKWLSFMEKRLKLGRRLLKPDGVMIVTIDEHEVHHLGMLLEKLFPDAYRQMVTIVINP
jgi:adenine-specific DNA-methyltransferase